MDLADRAQLDQEVYENAKHRITFDGVSPMDCEDCDGPIEPQRRQHLPGVTTCIQCARRREQRGRFQR